MACMPNLNDTYPKLRSWKGSWFENRRLRDRYSDSFRNLHLLAPDSLGPYGRQNSKMTPNDPYPSTISPPCWAEHMNRMRLSVL